MAKKKRIIEYLTPEAGHELIEKTYEQCTQEVRADNAMPDSLQALFNSKAAASPLALAKKIIFEFLPMKPEAHKAFLERRSSKDMMALAFMAYSEDKMELFNDWISQVEITPHVKGYVRNLIFDFRNGYSNKIDSLCEKATTQLLQSFETVDYAHMSEEEQALIIQAFSKSDWGYERSEPMRTAHRNIVKALHIPATIMALHEEKLTEFTRRIVCDDTYAEPYETMLDYKSFKDADADMRELLAAAHVENMASLYDVEVPEIAVFEEAAIEDGDNVYTTRMRMTTAYTKEGIWGDVIEITPRMMINKAVPNMGLHERFGSDFLDSLSHEFGHYLEAILALSLPDERDMFHLKEKELQTFPAIDPKSAFNEAARIFAFNCNTATQEQNYIDGAADYETYKQQLKERHAYWLGPAYEKAADKAIRLRRYISAPEKYSTYMRNNTHLLMEKLKPFSANPQIMNLVDGLTKLQDVSDKHKDSLDTLASETYAALCALYEDCETQLDDPLIPDQQQSVLAQTNQKLRELRTLSAELNRAVTEWLPAADAEIPARSFRAILTSPQV